jgi:hypothetical protein
MDSGIASLIGVGMGVIAANGAKVVEHYVQRRRAAEYLAVRVITVLDHFIAGCVPVTEDHGKVMPDGYHLEPEATLPKLEFDNLNVDWKSIKPDLAYAVLALPNHVAAGVQSINANYDPTNVPSHDFEGRQFQFARLGLLANGVIGLLTVVGRLPSVSPDRLKLVTSLNLAYERLTRRRESWKKEMAEFGKQLAQSAEASNKVMREFQGDAPLTPGDLAGPKSP